MGVDATAVLSKTHDEWEPIPIDSSIRLDFEECISRLQVKGVGFDDMLDCLALTTSEPVTLIRELFRVKFGLVQAIDVLELALGLDAVLADQTASSYAKENAREFIQACAKNGLAILIE